MTVLRRIAPASAFKVGIVAYGFVGLLLGALCSVVALAGVRFAPQAHLPFTGAIGLAAIIICPIIYGIIGGIAAAIGAAIYNLASGWVGGIEIDIAQS
jgi:hypothetical protein